MLGNFDYATLILKISISDSALAGLHASYSYEPMDSIMDSDKNGQSGVCHFSILFLVSFLSMVVAITIARKTKELKQLEECMMENMLIRKTESKYFEQCIKKVKSHQAAILSRNQINYNH